MIKNPLNKRILRDLKKDWLKYIALFLLMVFMIGIASGVFVGNDSMKYSIDESYEKYSIEYGHFQLKEKAASNLLDKVEDEVNIYEQFYKDADEVLSDKTINKIRLFKLREEINLLCIMEGRLPENKDEIVIDRSHADNIGIKVGDIIKVSNKDFEIVGLVAASDYTCLFENNAEMMFDSLTFDIAFLTEEAWDEINETIKYQYAFFYKNEPKDEIEEKEKSDVLVERIAVLAASGGYTDSKKEAEELKDNVEIWKEQLEEVEKEAKSLEERGELLKQKEKELNEKAYLIALGDQETIQMMTNLQKEAEEFQKDLENFQDKEEEIEEIVDELKELEPYEDNSNELIDYVPRYANQAIQFAKADLGKDQVMMNVLVYIFIAVLAFVFAITTTNKIKEEASVIGTLRATGFTRNELLRYYILLPTMITLLAAIFGNILGYTYFKDVAVSLYYNSYSLLKYETLWNTKAFIITTLTPLVLMIVINYFVISRLLKLSPLKFLRKDLSKSKRKKTMRLPSISFFKRFRLRILFQNVYDYITLFLGILFIMIILGFAIGLPETIDHYKSTVSSSLLADYQTILKDYKDGEDNIITTNTEDAEIFSMTSLFTVDGVRVDEDISVFGYQDDSKFINIKEKLEGNEIYISTAFRDKFNYREGDEIVLREKYSKNEYNFKVAGIYQYPSTLAIFMPNSSYTKIFKLDKDSFSGFFSKEEIKDVDEDMIYSVITEEDLMGLANQLDHSMGSFASYISWTCLIIGILVMYVLTKLIIEKNATSISMVKVLGYEDREINSLYIRLTTIIVILIAIVASLLAIYILNYLFKIILYSMSGWFSLYISVNGVIKMILIVLCAYVVVAYLGMTHIKKVPLNVALKNVE